MLVILYGTSCVGKTTIMKYMRKCYNWKMISVYTTRPIRKGESEKKQVDLEELVRGEATGEYLPLNQCYGVYYGTPTEELKMAENNRDGIWCLDFPIERKHLFDKYKYCGIIILPKNKEQLIEQIHKANRIERMEKIICEYEEQYISIGDIGLHMVVNYPNGIRHVCDEILEIVNSYWGTNYGNTI